MSASRPIRLCCLLSLLPQDMLTLTTRMNALARVTLGNVNISATTALQVGALLWRCVPGCSVM